MRVHTFPALACILSACVLLSACASAPRSASDPPAAAPVAKSAPAPKPGVNRFEMTRNGQRMTADDFDAWMKARGIRVAKGKPSATQSRPERKSGKREAGGASSTQGRATQR